MQNNIYHSVKIKIAILFEKTASYFKKIIRHIALFFKTRFQNHTDSTETENIQNDKQWKTEVLEEFKSWLSDVDSETHPSLSISPDSCDFYTLLSEFTALRQEIKMQNREQHRTLKSLNSIQSMVQSYQETMAMFNNKTKQIETLEKNIRRDCEKRTTEYFFDIRDALIRGRDACVKISAKRRFFRPAPKNLESIQEGYDMAIRKFDAAIALVDIHPVETTDVPFDPATMQALETKPVKNIEKGTVIETISGGFKRENEVLRLARVIVAE